MAWLPTIPPNASEHDAHRIPARSTRRSHTWMMAVTPIQLVRLSTHATSGSPPRISGPEPPGSVRARAKRRRDEQEKQFGPESGHRDGCQEDDHIPRVRLAPPRHPAIPLRGREAAAAATKAWFAAARWKHEKAYNAPLPLPNASLQAASESWTCHAGSPSYQPLVNARRKYHGPAIHVPLAPPREKVTGRGGGWRASGLSHDAARRPAWAGEPRT